MNNSRLSRIVQGKVVGGVAGGIAEFFAIDPTIVRLLFVLMVVFGGSGVLLYIILWIILPEKAAFDPYRVYNPSAAPPVTGERGSGVGETYEGFDRGMPPPSFQTGKVNLPATERKKIEGSLIGGALLIFIGGIFLVERFIPNIDFGDLWPLVIIALGMLLIFTNLPRVKKSEPDSQSPFSETTPVNPPTRDLQDEDQPYV